MNGNSIGIDTSWAIGFMDGDIRFARALSQFASFILPATVLGEILFGAVNSARVTENLQRVERLLLDCTLVKTDEAVARHYAEARLALKRKARPIPDNDLWIASTCLAHGVPLATLDQHFRYVDGLTVVGLSQ